MHINSRHFSAVSQGWSTAHTSNSLTTVWLTWAEWLSQCAHTSTSQETAFLLWRNCLQLLTSNISHSPITTSQPYHHSPQNIKISNHFTSEAIQWSLTHQVDIAAGKWDEVMATHIAHSELLCCRLTTTTHTDYLVLVSKRLILLIVLLPLSQSVQGLPRIGATWRVSQTTVWQPIGPLRFQQ